MMIETAVSRSQLMVGEEMTLDIIISDATGAIKPPVFPTLDGFSSYSQGRSQEISFINGQQSSKYVFTYVLIAKSLGHKTIGPFQVNVGGKDYEVAAVQVEIVPGGVSAPAGNAPAPSALPSRAMPSQVNNQDIFAKSWLDKDEVYVNEPAMLTYTLFTRLNATYKGFDTEPTTTGFWVEDFSSEKTAKRQEQIFNNSRYIVADVRKMALFPTEPGVFTIDTGTLSTNVEVRNQDDFDSFFSANVFGNRYGRLPSVLSTQVVPKLVPTEKVTLTVKALPDKGKPDNFTGAVGRYEIDSSIDKSQVEEGTPVTYKIRIFGQGNINTVDVPVLPKTENFKIYDSSSSVNIPKTRLVVEGEKVVETVIVPKNAGTFTVPALQFSFFDPQSEQYKQISTKPHTLVVTPSSHKDEETVTTPTTVDGEVDKKDVSPITKDIRYIKTQNNSPLLVSWQLHKNPLTWFLALLFLTASITFSVLSRMQLQSMKDARTHRLRRSHKVAKARLKTAESKMKQGSRDAFYAELSNALYGYFADKLGVSVQSVSREQIAADLDGSVEGCELYRKIDSLLNELAKGRYSSLQAGPEEMNSLYSQADDMITSYEKLKAKK